MKDDNLSYNGVNAEDVLGWPSSSLPIGVFSEACIIHRNMKITDTGLFTVDKENKRVFTFESETTSDLIRTARRLHVMLESNEIKNGTIEKMLSHDIALDYIMAGKAKVTLESLETKARFTYKITKKESTNAEKPGFIYFVSVYKGSDSVYAGLISYNENIDKFVYVQGQKGKLPASDQSIKALLYTINMLLKKKNDIKVNIYHCGVCGRCGRQLTTPESIMSGIGPECAKIAGVFHPKNIKNNE